MKVILIPLDETKKSMEFKSCEQAAEALGIAAYTVRNAYSFGTLAGGYYVDSPLMNGNEPDEKALEETDEMAKKLFAKRLHSRFPYTKASTQKMVLDKWKHEIEADEFVKRVEGRI